jgi:RNA polymerase sigma-70 factor (ECF subfamily)
VAPPTLKLRLLSGRPEGGQDAARPDDAQLLAAVRAGEPRSANDLYERSRSIVARTVQKLLGRGDRDEQDIFQQTMVEIVRSIDRYRGECPLDGWIATLAAHVVYKSLRRRRLERRIWSDAEPPEALTIDHSGARAAQRSTIERISKHLEAMDSGRSWAFLLHDVHGYDLRETAQIMGVSHAAAQSRLVRGRKELHQRIADDVELAGVLDDRGEGT